MIKISENIFSANSFTDTLEVIPVQTSV